MLTIRAMVEFGPWMLDHIDPLDSRSEACQRCGTAIKYVWVFHLTTTGEEWRIGSECGPKLVEISKEVWGEKTKRFGKMLRALLRLRKVEELLAGRPDLEPKQGWLRSQFEQIERGKMTDRELMILNSNCGQVERRSKWLSGP